MNWTRYVAVLIHDLNTMVSRDALLTSDSIADSGREDMISEFMT